MARGKKKVNEKSKKEETSVEAAVAVSVAVAVGEVEEEPGQNSAEEFKMDSDVKQGDEAQEENNVARTTTIDERVKDHLNDSHQEKQQQLQQSSVTVVVPRREEETAEIEPEIAHIPSAATNADYAEAEEEEEEEEQEEEEEGEQEEEEEKVSEEDIPYQDKSRGGSARHENATNKIISISDIADDIQTGKSTPSPNNKTKEIGGGVKSAVAASESPSDWTFPSGGGKTGVGIPSYSSSGAFSLVTGKSESSDNISIYNEKQHDSLKAGQSKQVSSSSSPSVYSAEVMEVISKIGSVEHTASLNADDKLSAGGAFPDALIELPPPHHLSAEKQHRTEESPVSSKHPHSRHHPQQQQNEVGQSEEDEIIEDVSSWRMFTASGEKQRPNESSRFQTSDSKCIGRGAAGGEDLLLVVNPFDDISIDNDKPSVRLFSPLDSKDTKLHHVPRPPPQPQQQDDRLAGGSNYSESLISENISSHFEMQSPSSTIPPPLTPPIPSTLLRLALLLSCFVYGLIIPLYILPMPQSGWMLLTVYCTVEAIIKGCSQGIETNGDRSSVVLLALICLSSSFSPVRITTEALLYMRFVESLYDLRHISSRIAAFTDTLSCSLKPNVEVLSFLAVVTVILEVANSLFYDHFTGLQTVSFLSQYVFRTGGEASPPPSEEPSSSSPSSASLIYGFLMLFILRGFGESLLTIIQKVSQEQTSAFVSQSDFSCGKLAVFKHDKVISSLFERRQACYFIVQTLHFILAIISQSRAVTDDHRSPAVYHLSQVFRYSTGVFLLYEISIDVALSSGETILKNSLIAFFIVYPASTYPLLAGFAVFTVAAKTRWFRPLTTFISALLIDFALYLFLGKLLAVVSYDSLPWIVPRTLQLFITLPFIKAMAMRYPEVIEIVMTSEDEQGEGEESGQGHRQLQQMSNINTQHPLEPDIEQSRSQIQTLVIDQMPSSSTRRYNKQLAAVDESSRIDQSASLDHPQQQQLQAAANASSSIYQSTHLKEEEYLSSSLRRQPRSNRHQQLSSPQQSHSQLIRLCQRMATSRLLRHISIIFFTTTGVKELIVFILSSESTNDDFLGLLQIWESCYLEPIFLGLFITTRVIADGLMLRSWRNMTLVVIMIAYIMQPLLTQTNLMFLRIMYLIQLLPFGNQKLKAIMSAMTSSQTMLVKLVSLAGAVIAAMEYIAGRNSDGALIIARYFVFTLTANLITSIILVEFSAQQRQRDGPAQIWTAIKHKIAAYQFKAAAAAAGGHHSQSSSNLVEVLKSQKTTVALTLYLAVTYICLLMTAVYNKHFAVDRGERAGAGQLENFREVLIYALSLVLILYAILHIKAYSLSSFFSANNLNKVLLIQAACLGVVISWEMFFSPSASSSRCIQIQFVVQLPILLRTKLMFPLVKFHQCLLRQLLMTVIVSSIIIVLIAQLYADVDQSLEIFLLLSYNIDPSSQVKETLSTGQAMIMLLIALLLCGANSILTLDIIRKFDLSESTQAKQKYKLIQTVFEGLWDQYKDAQDPSLMQADSLLPFLSRFDLSLKEEDEEEEEEEEGEPRAKVVCGSLQKQKVELLKRISKMKLKVNEAQQLYYKDLLFQLVSEHFKQANFSVLPRSIASCSRQNESESAFFHTTVMSNSTAEDLEVGSQSSSSTRRWQTYNPITSQVFARLAFRSWMRYAEKKMQRIEQQATAAAVSGMEVEEEDDSVFLDPQFLMISPANAYASALMP